MREEEAVLMASLDKRWIIIAMTETRP